MIQELDIYVLIESARHREDAYAQVNQWLELWSVIGLEPTPTHSDARLALERISEWLRTGTTEELVYFQTSRKGLSLGVQFHQDDLILGLCWDDLSLEQASVELKKLFDWWDAQAGLILGFAPPPPNRQAFDALMSSSELPTLTSPTYAYLGSTTTR